MYNRILHQPNFHPLINADFLIHFPSAPNQKKSRADTNRGSCQMITNHSKAFFSILESYISSADKTLEFFFRGIFQTLGILSIIKITIISEFTRSAHSMRPKIGSSRYHLKCLGSYLESHPVMVLPSRVRHQKHHPFLLSS